ncbi:MAG TPA: hypothetical protein VKD90_06000, partial [Gemmataceae bacterium]|nr:hypothetical protein [Gemmataceae bacterium]
MWGNWFRSVVIPAPRRSRRNHSHSSARRRPALDSLEDRTVPTVFTVNTAADTLDANPGDGIAADSTGATSLRAAIMEANALAGADTINIPAGGYPLTRPGVNEDSGLNGDLDIRGDLTINGAGRDTTIIDGNQLDRVFHVVGVFRSGGPTVTIANLTVFNGRAPSIPTSNGFDGGGVLNDFSTLTLNNVWITGNRAGDGLFGGSGGGVYTAVGTTTIVNSLISGNQAGNGTSIGGNGGGVGSLTSITTIRDTTIQDNRSGDGQAGAGLLTAGDGGGIYSASAERDTNGFLTVVNSTVTLNTVGTTTLGDGGGIITHDERFLLDTSVVSNNTAWRAGGVEIDITRSAEIRNSTIAGNKATAGGAGGIYHTTSFNQLATPTVITGTTVSGNQAPNSAAFDGGGGMINQGEIGSIVNSTFAQNSTNTVGGGIANYHNIGKIVNTTIAENAANDGGGLFHMLFANFTPRITELSNTIIANNTATGTANEDYVQKGAVDTARNNLVEAPGGHPLSNGINGNVVGFDPKLADLANNGGPTKTYALIA